MFAMIMHNLPEGIITYITTSNDLRLGVLIAISIIFHNIPEGLVLGVAYGSVIYNFNSTTTLSAIILTIGIAIQNFPEGSAISLPMRSCANISARTRLRRS